MIEKKVIATKNALEVTKEGDWIFDLTLVPACPFVWKRYVISDDRATGGLLVEGYTEVAVDAQLKAQWDELIANPVHQE